MRTLESRLVRTDDDGDYIVYHKARWRIEWWGTHNQFLYVLVAPFTDTVCDVFFYGSTQLHDLGRARRIE